MFRDDLRGLRCLSSWENVYSDVSMLVMLQKLACPGDPPTHGRWYCLVGRVGRQSKLAFDNSGGSRTQVFPTFLSIGGSGGTGGEDPVVRERK